jgi:Mg2+ and Co2+ transporter CorA
MNVTVPGQTSDQDQTFFWFFGICTSMIAFSVIGAFLLSRYLGVS